MDHSNIFFCFSIHKKLNGQKKISGHFCLRKKKVGSLKKTLKKNFIIGSHRGGFQFMLILDLWGISFHPAVVVGLGNDLLFKSVLAHCGTNYGVAWMGLNFFDYHFSQQKIMHA